MLFGQHYLSQLLSFDTVGQAVLFCKKPALASVFDKVETDLRFTSEMTTRMVYDYGFLSQLIMRRHLQPSSIKYLLFQYSLPRWQALCKATKPLFSFLY